MVNWKDRILGRKNKEPNNRITDESSLDSFDDSLHSSRDKLLKQANKGDVEAQYKLGDCYYYGTDVEQDYRQAIMWYTKAAQQRHAEAQCKLGDCYRYGDGVEEDSEQAMEWYTEAAKQGHTEAQSNIAMEYYFKRDYKKTIELYEQILKKNANFISEQRNSGFIYLILGECYYFAEVPYKNANKATELYNKAVEDGEYQAKPYLAFCYIFGDGVPVDLQKAFELFWEADQKGMEGDRTEHLADFMLCHLIANRILLELAKHGRTDEVMYALSDPIKRKNFTEITNAWTTPVDSSERVNFALSEIKMIYDWQQESGMPMGNDAKFHYDVARVQTLSNAWESAFGPNTYNSRTANKGDFKRYILKFYNPRLFEWLRYFHFTMGYSKEEIIGDLLSASFGNYEAALDMYRMAWVSFSKMAEQRIRIL